MADYHTADKEGHHIRVAGHRGQRDGQPGLQHERVGAGGDQNLKLANAPSSSAGFAPVLVTVFPPPSSVFTRLYSALPTTKSSRNALVGCHSSRP